MTRFIWLLAIRANVREFKVGNPGAHPTIFTFKTAAGNGYLLNVHGESTSNTDSLVVLDVNTGKLIAVAEAQINNNYFDLAVEPSPDYATLTAPGHKLVKSAESDGKALSMNLNRCSQRLSWPVKKNISTACLACGSIPPV